MSQLRNIKKIRTVIDILNETYPPSPPTVQTGWRDGAMRKFVVKNMKKFYATYSRGINMWIVECSDYYTWKDKELSDLIQEIREAEPDVSFAIVYTFVSVAYARLHGKAGILVN